MQTESLQFSYDAKANAAYVQIAAVIDPGSAVRNFEVDTGPDDEFTLILDFSADGHLLGLEILNVTSALDSETLSRFSSPED